MVTNKPTKASVFSLPTIALCAHVTLTPDDNRITVFKSGIPQGSSVSIPKGGQIQPISTDGDKLEWKNAQKKEKKNITSETINKAIP